MVRFDELNGATDAEFALDLIETTGVLVVHGSGFGTDPADGYFRMVYLADEVTLNRAFNGIASVIEDRVFVEITDASGLPTRTAV